MKISLRRVDDALAMEAENANGNKVRMDASEQAGGKASGASPMEMVLMAAAGCSSIDIIDILKKQRHEIDDLQVEAEGTRAENPPKVFTHIKLTFYIAGEVPESKVKRAVDLSMTKYCSVSQMLEKATDISYEVYLNDSSVS